MNATQNEIEVLLEIEAQQGDRVQLCVDHTDNAVHIRTFQHITETWKIGKWEHFTETGLRRMRAVFMKVAADLLDQETLELSPVSDEGYEYELEDKQDER